VDLYRLAEAAGEAASASDGPARDWLPEWLYADAWADWRRWRMGRWRRIATRAQSSVCIDVDTSVDACVRASLLLGLKRPLFAGDRVRMTRRCGRELEQPEARVVLGAYRGLLWYQIDSQREGGTVDGSSLAWCWLPCDVDGLKFVAHGRFTPPILADVPLEMLAPFRGGKLQVVYDQAVVREGLEIDTSEKVGEVERGAILRAEERRVNSSNIARYRINHKGVAGWISERIRGESEDLIVIRLRPSGRELSPLRSRSSSIGESEPSSPADPDAAGMEGSGSGSGAQDEVRSEDEDRTANLGKRADAALQRWKALAREKLSSAMDTGEGGALAGLLMSGDLSEVWCTQAALDAEETVSLQVRVDAARSWMNVHKKYIAGLATREFSPLMRWTRGKLKPSFFFDGRPSWA
jgi:hypothetical protein